MPPYSIRLRRVNVPYRPLSLLSNEVMAPLISFSRRFLPRRSSSSDGGQSGTYSGAAIPDAVYSRDSMEEFFVTGQRAGKGHASMARELKRWNSIWAVASNPSTLAAP